MFKWFNKKIICVHHWHIVHDSQRKVPSGEQPVCERIDTEHKKYIVSGILGLEEIHTKCIRECCRCDSQEIKDDWMEATIPSQLKLALSYKDIKEHPLDLNHGPY